MFALASSISWKGDCTVLYPIFLWTTSLTQGLYPAPLSHPPLSSGASGDGVCGSRPIVLYLLRYEPFCFVLYFCTLYTSHALSYFHIGRFDIRGEAFVYETGRPYPTPYNVVSDLLTRFYSIFLGFLIKTMCKVVFFSIFFF